MKYDPAFIEAIKRYVDETAQLVMAAHLEGEHGQKWSVRTLTQKCKEAEAHLDSFGEEE